MVDRNRHKAPLGERGGDYAPEEAQKRFESALRGARVTGHKSMGEISPKRNLGRVAKRTKAKKPRASG